MTESDLIGTLKVHTFEPGDRLILKLAHEIYYEDMLHLREQFEKWAPGVKVAVLSPGMELEVARGLEPVESA